MRNDLHLEICGKCGEAHEDGNGLWAMLNNPCYGNRITYRIPTGRKMMNILQSFFNEHYPDDMKSFRELMVFPHFKPMENLQEASWLEKNNYSHVRDYEVKQMKRLRSYIKEEEDFTYKY